METRELTDMTAVLRSINDGNPSNAERWVTLTQRVVRAETRANAAERAAARKDWEKQNAEYDSWQSNYRAEVARLQHAPQGTGVTEIVTPQNQNTAVQP